MKSFFKKKSRFENSLLILFAIIGLGYGLITYLNGNYDGLRIIKLDILAIILSILSLIILGFWLFLFFTKNQNQLLKRVLYLVSIIICGIVLIDFLVLGIVRSFVIASQLTKIEAATKSLTIRLAYLCIKNYRAILTGVWTTIWLSLLGTIIGLIIALLFITLRTLEVTSRDNELVAFLKKIGCGFVKIYVAIFRGTPMMVQAIIIYYFLPGILASLFGIQQEILNRILSVSVAGLITVSLNTTAYLTEVLRGGIEALNKGQMEASRSLGMSRAQTMLHVILPQGIKNSLPSICNEFIINIKDTSVLNVIAVMDLFFIIDSINGKNANNDAIFIAAIIYLCLTYGISKLLGLLEKRMNLVSKPLPSSN